MTIDLPTIPLSRNTGLSFLKPAEVVAAILTNVAPLLRGGRTTHGEYCATFVNVTLTNNQ